MLLTSGVPKPPKGFKRQLGYAAPLAPLFRAVPVRAAQTPPGPTNRRSATGAPRATAAASSTDVTVTTSASARHPRAPIVAYKIRGKLPTGELTDEARQAALDDLDADAITPGSATALTSAMNTWTYFHKRWHGTVQHVHGDFRTLREMRTSCHLAETRTSSSHRGISIR